MTITSKITYSYLMNKSKSELAHWILRDCDERDHLIREIYELLRRIDYVCEVEESSYQLPISVADDVQKFIARYTDYFPATSSPHSR